MQLSLLQNICPSRMAKTPPPRSPPPFHEVAWPIQDGQVGAMPGPPLSLSGPAVLVTSGAGGRASSTMTPVSAPSEVHARTLTGQLKGHAAGGISMKDDRVVPLLPSYPGGCNLCALACPLAKVRGEPSSAMSINKKDHTPPPRRVLSLSVFFSYT